MSCHKCIVVTERLEEYILQTGKIPEMCTECQLAQLRAENNKLREENEKLRKRVEESDREITLYLQLLREKN